MRRILLLALASGLTACASQQPRHDIGAVDTTPLSLIPQPAQLQRLAGRYALTATTPISVAAGDAAARRVAVQLQGWIRQTRGITLPIVEGKPRNGAIALVSEAAQKGREAYTLDVGAKGVRIAANDET